MSQTLSHVYEVYIRTTPEKLWKALTDPEMTKQYFYGSAVESTWKVGGPLNRLSDDGEHMLDGEVLEIDPPRTLVHTFIVTDPDHISENPDPPSKVTWKIEPMGEVCKLTLTHEHYAGETETSRSTLTGWNPVLSGLKTLLETGKPLAIAFPQEAAAR